jgi:uncharacterized coiled-coil protein SlyX
MPALIRPKKAVTVSIIANVHWPRLRQNDCRVAQSKEFRGKIEDRARLMIWCNSLVAFGGIEAENLRGLRPERRPLGSVNAPLTMMGHCLEQAEYAVTYRDDDDSHDLPDEEPRPRVLSTLVAVLLLAGTGSGSAWLWWAYGNGAPFPSFTSTADKAVAAVDRPVGLNDFQAFQQQITGSLQSTERLLTAQQAEIKRLSDQVSTLAGKLDLLQRPVAAAQAAFPAPAPKRAGPAPQKKPREDKPVGAISTGGAPLAAPVQLSR